MKLGKRKFIFVRMLFIISLMVVIGISTVSYLYYTDNLNSSDYLKLILSDTYDNNFYNNFVEFVSNNINPLKFIEFNNNEYKSSYSNNIDNPIIYLYNSNQSLSYKVEYNNKLNVYNAAYFLSEELNKVGINTIFEDTLVNDINKNDINVIVSDKLTNYKSLKYIIDIGRTNKSDSNIVVNKIKYSNIDLHTNKKNIEFIKKLHITLNRNCKGISKIYFSNSYDDNIKIDIGGYNSSMSTVLKSIKVLSKSISEVINGS